jgi:nitrate/nitrite transporter NarK
MQAQFLTAHGPEAVYFRAPGRLSRNLRGRLAERLYGELSGRVAAHHARDQRLRHVGFPQAGQLSTIRLIIAGMIIGSWWAMVGLSIATQKGPFWSIPPMFITGTAAAASIAWINSLGNLGGFFGPWYVGVIKDWTGTYAGGLYGLAFLCVVSAVVCALFLDIPNSARTRVVAPEAAD